MKAYLINLARSTERLASADAQLRAAGIAYERIEAVDGRALGWGKLCHAVSRYRFALVTGHSPSLGEVGCTLSHNLALRRLVESGESMALIFEDDVVVDGAALREALDVVRDHARPEDPAIYVLSDHFGAESPSGGCGVMPAGDTCYAEAYVVTVAAARRLLFLNTPIRAPIDSWGPWAKRGIAVWRAFPIACRQSGVASDIQGEKVAKPKRRAGWGWYVALWRARMAAFQALDSLIYRVTGR